MKYYALFTAIMLLAAAGCGGNGGQDRVSAQPSTRIRLIA